MAFAIRRKTSAALLAVATVGALGATAAPAGATVQQQAPDRYLVCAEAPDGSLVLDYDTGGDPDADNSVCWAGSGRTANNLDDRFELRQVHTANNRGSLHLKTEEREWDLPFDRNQTHDIPNDTVLLGLSLNE
ncbi:hypothetical protein IM697_39315 [Streptomyces ferrugineus]|uniref:Ricin B lectin domain-containing protein n=1 Tax=Streptomyces ferrugineus TaxID=1413221 RepID=A0A7M2SLD3_9ACTN|nr:hypothetical protein [Streptomyces ferrugineus]QOV36021.1 hypothetical protein IM697_39315 [Streptomyces ferrugineus]